MDVASIKNLLNEILSDELVPDGYKEEVEMFLTFNTSSQDILAEAYELAQDMIEYNQGEKLPASVSRFVVFKLRDEVEHDNDNAACMLGIIYLQGRCAGTDYGKAVSCFEKAASLGNVRGLALLAMCNYYGFGTDVNYEQAGELLSLTGKDALGLLLQGKMLADERNKSADKAEAYFKFLECQDVMDSCDRALFGAELYCSLGDCYSEGYAGNRDNCEALKYYRLAEVQYYRRIFNGDRFSYKGLEEAGRKAEIVEKAIRSVLPENKWNQ